MQSGLRGNTKVAAHQTCQHGISRCTAPQTYTLGMQVYRTVYWVVSTAVCLLGCVYCVVSTQLCLLDCVYWVVSTALCLLGYFHSHVSSGLCLLHGVYWLVSTGL